MNIIRKIKTARYRHILRKELAGELNNPNEGWVFLDREQSRMLRYIGCPTMSKTEGYLCGYGDDTCRQYLREKRISLKNALQWLYRNSSLMRQDIVAFTPMLIDKDLEEK